MCDIHYRKKISNVWFQWIRLHIDYTQDNSHEAEYLTGKHPSY